MSSSMVSFRISRSAEDLAETVHALSQRLVKLEQRLAVMELDAAHQQAVDPEEMGRLDNVERLLRDCRDLLETDGPTADGAATFDPESESVAASIPEGLNDEVRFSSLPSGAPGEEDPFQAEPFADVA
jgi:hypothetical protein